MGGGVEQVYGEKKRHKCKFVPRILSMIVGIMTSNQDTVTHPMKPFLGKSYSHITLSIIVYLVKSNFICFHFFMISNTSDDIIRAFPWPCESFCKNAQDKTTKTTPK